jgi:hypothetical protein
VASVDVTHPRGNVLQLMVRFAQPLPPSPSYALIYSLANNGTTIAVLNSQQGADNLAIRKAQKANTADVRTDKETHAGRIVPDTVEISLDLTKFRIDKGFVNPRSPFRRNSTRRRARRSGMQPRSVTASETRSGRTIVVNAAMARD